MRYSFNPSVIPPTYFYFFFSTNHHSSIHRWVNQRCETVYVIIYTASPFSTDCFILAMAFPWLSPFGHTLVQFMMVLHRYSL